MCRGVTRVIIFTKDGEPINRRDDDLFDTSGKQVARLKDDKAFGPDGRYIATLVNNRLIYFSHDSNLLGPTFRPNTVAGFSVARIAGIATYGDEPNFS